MRILLRSSKRRFLSSSPLTLLPKRKMLIISTSQQPTLPIHTADSLHNNIYPFLTSHSDSISKLLSTGDRNLNPPNPILYFYLNPPNPLSVLNPQSTTSRTHSVYSFHLIIPSQPTQNYPPLCQPTHPPTFYSSLYPPNPLHDHLNPLKINPHPLSIPQPT